MRILVTAGNTLVHIDRVRCITNIFTGYTGAAIAEEAYRRGHDVTLVTSHPEAIQLVLPNPERWHWVRYRTFFDLHSLLAQRLASPTPDALVHCAAVSDFLPAGIYAPAPGAQFDRVQNAWQGDRHMLKRTADKVKSDDPELWLRLVRAPKLVEKMRGEWHFRGVLVKFKLEVDITEDALLAIAEKSRQQSAADWMVANTLEGSAEWALVGNERGYKKVTRSELPGALLDVLEMHHG